ncbi:MAG: hypothetical protein ACRCTZ_00555 [Sarcina sp.]
MKKTLVSVLLATSIGLVGATTVAQAQTANSNSGSVVNVGENQVQDNLLTYQEGSNSLSSISSNKATEFDQPQATENGILLRMNSTTIQTKYGQMQIEQNDKGYTVTNLSNPKAPILTVGVINNIYGVNSQVDLKGLVTPVLTNSSGQKIKGTIIFPTINTSQPTYQETYIEAKDEAGNITVVPFIYNVVQFKDSINVPKDFNVQNLTVNDILSGGQGNLRSYVAHYDQGSDKIIVGVSRGVASIRKEIPITFGEQKTPTKESTQTPEKPVKQETRKQEVSQTPSIPMYMKILVSPITYIVVGAILIALIYFLCF